MCNVLTASVSVIKQTVKAIMTLLLRFVFVFVNMEPYGSKYFKQHLLGRNISDSLSTELCILLKRASTKVAQRIVRFQIWILPFLFVCVWFSLSWDNMRVNVSNDTTSESKHHIHSPIANFRYTIWEAYQKLFNEM